MWLLAAVADAPPLCAGLLCIVTHDAMPDLAAAYLDHVRGATDMPWRMAIALPPLNTQPMRALALPAWARDVPTLRSLDAREAALLDADVQGPRDRVDAQAAVVRSLLQLHCLRFERVAVLVASTESAAAPLRSACAELATVCTAGELWAGDMAAVQ